MVIEQCMDILRDASWEEGGGEGGSHQSEIANGLYRFSLQNARIQVRMNVCVWMFAYVMSTHLSPQGWSDSSGMLVKGVFSINGPLQTNLV